MRVIYLSNCESLLYAHDSRAAISFKDTLLKQQVYDPLNWLQQELVESLRVQFRDARPIEEVSRDWLRFVDRRHESYHRTPPSPV